MGKSTSAAALGSLAQAAGSRVLLVDLDAQANLTKVMGQERNSAWYLALMGFIAGKLTQVPDLEPVVQKLEHGEGLLASDRVMSTLDEAMRGLEVGADSVLADVLEPLTGSYDLIIIDCPPILNRVTVNALVAATEVLIPVETEAFAVDGLADLLTTIKQVQRRANRDLRITGIMPTKVKSNTVAHKIALEQITDIANRFGIRLLPQIRSSIKAADAASSGVPVVRYPDANGIASDYRAVMEVLSAK